MLHYVKPVEILVEELSRLPGIGPKSAQRLAFYILKSNKEDMKRLVNAILEVKDKIGFCSVCFNITDKDICDICTSEKRDPSVICVVEEPKDIIAIERTGEFRGRYHVLQGAISPLDGIGPEKLKVRELLNRMKDGEVKEVIIATNPNIEGETTAMYISKLLNPLGIMVSRLASGLPVGGDLDYADELTLGKALEGRRKI